jgi:penicillin-binding protein 1A
MMDNFLQRLKLLFSRVYHYFKPFTFKKFLVLTSALAVSGFLFIFLLFLLVWSGALGSLPDKEELVSIENPAASEVYSADSVLLGRYFHSGKIKHNV